MNRIINVSTMTVFVLTAILAISAVFFAHVQPSYAFGDSGDGGCCGGGGSEGGGDRAGRDYYFYDYNPPVYQQPKAPTCSLSANPSIVPYNGNVTVKWSTNHASSVSISGLGSVSQNGTRTDYNLTSSKAYVLTAYGAGGTVTCYDSVTVHQAPSCPSGTTGTYPNCTVPTPSCPAGSTGNFPVCIVNNVVCPSGSIQQGNICIVNNNNNVNNNVVTVNVPSYSQPAYNNPSCTVQVSQSYVTPGQPVTVSWFSQNASYGFMNDGMGNVALSGSRTVYPYAPTTYTGTFYGQNGQQVNCSATVSTNTYQNPTPYVTLSAVPYTGLDLGPVGTALYWAFLVAWTLFAAYLIAIKRVHMSIYRWYNEMLFGTEVSASQVTRTAVHATAAPVEHNAIDPFVLSQINRAHN